MPEGKAACINRVRELAGGYADKLALNEPHKATGLWEELLVAIDEVYMQGYRDGQADASKGTW